MTDLKKTKPTITIKNRKASYLYELLDEFDAGISLVGSEVKVIRQGNANISSAYCYVNNGSVILKNMHIDELKNAVLNHDPLRERNLLLTKKEIRKIEALLKNKGLTLIPTFLYFKKGLVKIKISICKGKKNFQKKESIKAKDIERDLKKEGF